MLGKTGFALLVTLGVGMVAAQTEEQMNAQESHMMGESDAPNVLSEADKSRQNVYVIVQGKRRKVSFGKKGHIHVGHHAKKAVHKAKNRGAASCFTPVIW